MKSRVPPLFPILAFGAVLGAVLAGCASSEPAPEPRGFAAPPEEKTSEPETAAPASAEELLAVRLSAREWWKAVMCGDKKSADLYVMTPEDNEFLIGYVRELGKNAASDAEARSELERMRRAVFGKAVEQDGFVIVPMLADGKTLFKVFFRKRNGRRLIFTIN